jgi:hypothetical protein
MSGEAEAHPTGLVAMLPGVMRVMMSASSAGTWTDDDEACLAGLRQEASRSQLFEPDQKPPPPAKVVTRAVTSVLLAMGHASGVEARASSPWPEERPGAAEIEATVAEAETALTLLKEADGIDPGTVRVARLLRVNCVKLLMSLGRLTGKTPELLARIDAHADQIPRSLALLSPAVGVVKTGARLFTGQITPSDDAVLALANENRNLWDSMGADYARAEAAANRADESGDPADIRAAITELGTVWIGLPAGSPARGRTLTLLAEMHLALAASTDNLTWLTDAAGLAITAIRTAPESRAAHGGACVLADCLTLQAVIGHFEGPFAEAAAELRHALARSGPADATERAALLTAAAAAAGMHAAAAGEQSWRLAEEAERLLPGTAPSGTAKPTEWLLYHRTAQSLHRWTAVQVLARHDAEGLPVALRAAAKAEGSLTAGVGTASALLDLRQTRKKLLAAQRRIRHGKSLVPEPAGESVRVSAERFATLTGRFRSPFADFRRALARQLSDTRQRSRAHQTLARSLAELYLADPAAGSEVLRDAVEHLVLTLATGDFALPTTERADLLDLLARCYHESGRRDNDAWARHRGERAARAALRELAGVVLVTQNHQEALAVTAQAGEIAIRATTWCLADKRFRAAVDVAELGRSLLLAAAVTAGRTEELLRGAGLAAAAGVWRDGTDDAARAAALEALWDIPGGPGLLAVPTAAETSASMGGTRLDAVVYLVPANPRTGRGTGHAVLVRPTTGEVEVLALKRLASLDGTPLAAYLTALERAVTASGAGAGFRRLPEGIAWASALDQLGQWTYDTLVAPLLAHASRWHLDGLPRLALIPLSQLGAIPFAAAWTPGEGGSRRYAIEDVVLSYAASARLLAAAASRPRRRLDERVVFVADPTGELDFSRRVLPGLAARLYPGSAVYGLNRAPNGPATAAVLLDTLPGDGPGASLLHLTTHGRLAPEPAVQTRDGWLPLAEVLDQARGHAPDAPGGLVITSACLTDTALVGYDESLTLASAFLAAGATAVIGTRWPVENGAETALSVRLHGHLRDGRDPAEALRRAQLDLLRPDGALRDSLGPDLAPVDDSELSDPASWAGHVHHGI